LKQNIGQMQRQMSRVGYGGGRRGAMYQRMQNQQIAAEVNLAQSNLNQMNQQLAQLKKNAPKPQDKKKVEDEAAKRRETLHDAVAELVKTSDEIGRNYHELHQA